MKSVNEHELGARHWTSIVEKAEAISTGSCCHRLGKMKVMEIHAHNPCTDFQVKEMKFSLRAWCTGLCHVLSKAEETFFVPSFWNIHLSLKPSFLWEVSSPMSNSDQFHSMENIKFS
jgi:hypothetical protein